MNRIQCAVLLLLVCALPSWAEGDATAGKALYAPCAVCHGAAGEGNPDLQAPVLAGLDGAYLLRQLENFSTGLRGAEPGDTLGAQMRSQAAALPDAEARADVVAHIATLAPRASATPAAGDLRNGNNYYQSKCGACHGGSAQGNTLLFAPRLAGQDPAYLKRQYLNFQSGLRGARAEDRYGRQMRIMATSLPSAKDLDDVLAFIGAQAAKP